MSMLSFLDPALDLAYSILIGLAAVLHPLAGNAAVVLALILITLTARALLVPLAVSVLRSDRAKRALAPELDRVRRRHRSDPVRLASEMQQTYRQAGVSPFAGLLPALAQAPVMMIVYRLCKVPVIAGGHNAVLVAQLAGAPLAGHAITVLTTSGLLSAPVLVVAGLLATLLVLAYLSARQQVARLRAATSGDAPAVQLLLARVMPYGTVLVAAVVPLAVAVYLLTSTAWLVAERALLPRYF
jgi:YidC/Oxa1 family membrane protein insertase